MALAQARDCDAEQPGEPRPCAVVTVALCCAHRVCAVTFSVKHNGQHRRASNRRIELAPRWSGLEFLCERYLDLDAARVREFAVHDGKERVAVVAYEIVAVAVALDLVDQLRQLFVVGKTFFGFVRILNTLAVDERRVALRNGKFPRRRQLRMWFRTRTAWSPSATCRSDGAADGRTVARGRRAGRLC